MLCLPPFQDRPVYPTKLTGRLGIPFAETIEEDTSLPPFTTIGQGELWAACTEENILPVLASLRAAPVIGNTYVGIGLPTSLDLASVRPSIETIYLFDCATKIKLFWDAILPILQRCPSRHEARDQWIDLMKNNKGGFFNLPVTATGQGEAVVAAIEEGKSFLSDDARYNKIHDLAQRGRIVFYQVDLTDEKYTGPILEHLKQRKIDTIYFSNLHLCQPGPRVRHLRDFVTQLSMNRPARHHVIMVPEHTQQFIEGYIHSVAQQQFMHNYNRNRRYSQCSSLVGLISLVGFGLSLHKLSSSPIVAIAFASISFVLNQFWVHTRNREGYLLKEALQEDLRNNQAEIIRRLSQGANIYQTVSPYGDAAPELFPTTKCRRNTTVKQYFANLRCNEVVAYLETLEPDVSKR